VPVDLNPTLDLHRRILSELEIRETATEEQETEARRALDNALQSIAAERRAIKQCRDLLTQAATLYKSFVGKDRVTTQSDVLQPTEAPVAVAAPELTPAPAVASDEPSPLATQALAPDANVPQPTESPVAVAAPELTPVPAVAGDEPSPLATEAPAPDANVPEPSRGSSHCPAGNIATGGRGSHDERSRRILGISARTAEFHKYELRPLWVAPRLRI